MNKDEEIKIILSFLFKRSGKTQVKEAELYLPLSLELKWFSSSVANQFVHYALHQNFLKKTNGLVTPTFDISTITIPMGFKPTSTTFTLHKKEENVENKEKKLDKTTKDTTETLMQLLQQKTNKKPCEINKELEKITTEKDIHPSVALLLLAYTYELPVQQHINSIIQSVIQENEE